MFKFFKKANEEQTIENSVPSKKSNAVDVYTPDLEQKKVHGEDGVCCGSCGGE
mgnify:CR=1 FL=1